MHVFRFVKLKMKMTRCLRCPTLANFAARRHKLTRAIITVIFVIFLTKFLHYIVYQVGVGVPLRFFRYPLDINFNKLLSELNHGKTPKNIRIINPYPFKHRINNEQVCTGNGKRPTVVFLIKSRFDNFDHRSAIRDTWGGPSVEMIRTGVIRKVFLLGDVGPNQAKIQAKIAIEAATYNDIVQDTFEDTYLNNTYKLIMGFRWARKFCDRADYVMFVDDDYFVSPDYLLNHLVYDHFYTNQIEGYTVANPIPYRNPFNKWHVSYYEYPYAVYPKYAYAGAFIMRSHAVTNLNYTFPYVKYLRFDDVYLGIAARKAGIQFRYNNRFHGWKVNVSSPKCHDTIASHGYGDHDELRRVWTDYQTRKRDYGLLKKKEGGCLPRNERLEQDVSWF